MLDKLLFPGDRKARRKDTLRDLARAHAAPSADRSGLQHCGDCRGQQSAADDSKNQEQPRPWHPANTIDLAALHPAPFHRHADHRGQQARPTPISGEFGVAGEKQEIGFGHVAPYGRPSSTLQSSVCTAACVV